MALGGYHAHMDTRIVTVKEGQTLTLPPEWLEQAGIFHEAEILITEAGLLIRPRIQPFEEALEQVLTDHHDLLRSLAER